MLLTAEFAALNLDPAQQEGVAAVVLPLQVEAEKLRAQLKLAEIKTQALTLELAHLRRIRFKDPESGKTLVFLTNNMTLPPLTIAALYKSRWQVELFFKWIKQHLRIKKFLGTSENAVKTQIWCAVSTYVLIAIVKKELQLDASLYTLLQILSVSVFEKTEGSCALRLDAVHPETFNTSNQLNLFDF